MPVYSYGCNTCGRFERVNKFVNRALAICPKCGQNAHMEYATDIKSVTMERRGPLEVAIPKGIEDKMKERQLNQKRSHDSGKFIEDHGIHEAAKHGYVDPTKKRSI